MNKPVISSAQSIIDGMGNFDLVHEQIEILKNNGIPVTEFIIDPLKTGWDSEILPNHFRSGASPITALEKAYEFIVKEEKNVVLITGRDYLKSEYSPEERRDLMEIYPGTTIPNVYNELALAYIKENNLTENDFKHIAEKIFENYQRSAKARGIKYQSSEKWYNFITTLFRGVDIANPVVDFHAKVLIVSDDLYKKYFKSDNAVKLTGVSCVKLGADGPDAIEKIVKYGHLKTTYNKACEMAGIDFNNEFKNNNAFLEIYTCFPVVPLAFMQKTGLASNKEELLQFLENYEITVTGGMNLAKAAFNNPVLNALVVMFEKLQESDYKYGLVHGNGGLGYQQGAAIMEK